MKTTKTTLFWSKITIGLEKNYSQEPIDKSKIIQFIQDYQNRLIKENGIYLSAKVVECDIVLSGQIEPHLTLSFINYPKFPLPTKALKNTIEAFTKALMQRFEQNRVIIEHFDETIMIEKNDCFDNRIKTY